MIVVSIGSPVRRLARLKTRAWETLCIMYVYCTSAHLLNCHSISLTSSFSWIEFQYSAKYSSTIVWASLAAAHILDCRSHVTRPSGRSFLAIHRPVANWPVARAEHDSWIHIYEDSWIVSHKAVLIPGNLQKIFKKMQKHLGLEHLVVRLPKSWPHEWKVCGNWTSKTTTASMHLICYSNFLRHHHPPDTVKLSKSVPHRSIGIGPDWGWSQGSQSKTSSTKLRKCLNRWVWMATATTKHVWQCQHSSI